MAPADALRRIVYLLDRRLAPGRKAQAFQRAADLVAGLPDGELEQLVNAGRVEDLPGIGTSTGQVIVEAMRGEVPSYVANLEADAELPLSAGGRAYRAALKGDCHAHSTWSDGGASIEAMAMTARALGHEYLVLTDHSPRLTVAHGLDRHRLTQQLAVIGKLNVELAPFRILTGMEVDILEDGALDMDDDLLERLDVVVGSVHSKLRMDGDSMTKRMVLAIANPHVDILGHCTGRQVSLEQRSRPDTPAPSAAETDPKRPPSDFDPEIVFAACAQFDTAVEINCRPERQDPPDELLDLALDWGCKIAIDTDAHATGQLDWQRYGCDKAARHSIDVDTVVNAWDADTLLAWTSAHA
ncbi:MAG: PHP domain-containing protein [Actinobacteria bacterium]|nr:PHP domain-containing protein [Actinomycetota bacterium]